MDGAALLIEVPDPENTGQIYRLRIESLEGEGPYTYSTEQVESGQEGPSGETSPDVVTQFTLGLYEVFLGTSGADTIETGDCDFTIVLGFAGADTINTGSGKDYVYGMGGNDEISTDDGDDTILGGAGNDIIYGWSGADRI